MAYPFIQCPTWQEIVDLLKGLEVEFVERDWVGIGTPPMHVKLQFFSHRMDGDVIEFPVHIRSLEDRALPSVLRQVCVGLKIHPRCFGLDLD